MATGGVDGRLGTGGSDAQGFTDDVGKVRGRGRPPWGRTSPGTCGGRVVTTCAFSRWPVTVVAAVAVVAAAAGGYIGLTSTGASSSSGSWQPGAYIRQCHLEVSRWAANARHRWWRVGGLGLGRLGRHRMPDDPGRG